MNDYMMIHETVIRDVLDVIDGVRDVDGFLPGISNRSRSFKSIASASSNLTLVFPVMMERNVNIDNASMTTKAIERKAVSMLQMLFSALSISDSDNGMDYIKNFHTNMKIDDEITVDSFIDAMDKFVISKESGIRVTDAVIYERAKADLRNINYFLPDSISPHGLNTFKVNTNGYYRESVINEAPNTTVDVDGMHINVKNSNVYNTGRGGNGGGSSMKDKTDFHKNQLLDNDVKKSNELVPTTMIVNFVSTGQTGEPVDTQIIIGIKAKMYPIDTIDIMNRITLKHKDKNGLLKFIKSSTREISFVRDFLFAIDKAKLDALSQSKRGSSSKIWKILERMALKSKVRRGLGQVNDASAITTLVVSQELVEDLRKNENIDIEKPGIIRPIMESYNFMCVVIIDEAGEVAKFIFDTGDDIYENLSFRSLERESANNDYKRIVNLMSKMR